MYLTVLKTITKKETCLGCRDSLPCASLSPFSQSVTLTALLYDRTPLHTTQGVDKPTTSFVFLAISFRLLTYRSGSSILESSGSLNLAYVVLNSLFRLFFVHTSQVE